MIDFLASAQGVWMVIVILVLFVIGYVLICAFEALFLDDFDPVTEEKCKKCIHYDTCRDHGCKYECIDFFTEKDLRKRGVQ